MHVLNIEPPIDRRPRTAPRTYTDEVKRSGSNRGSKFTYVIETGQMVANPKSEPRSAVPASNSVDLDETFCMMSRSFSHLYKRSQKDLKLMKRCLEHWCRTIGRTVQ